MVTTHSNPTDGLNTLESLYSFSFLQHDFLFRFLFYPSILFLQTASMIDTVQQVPPVCHTDATLFVVPAYQSSPLWSWSVSGVLWRCLVLHILIVTPIRCVFKALVQLLVQCVLQCTRYNILIHTMLCSSISWKKYNHYSMTITHLFRNAMVTQYAWA